MVGMQMHGSKVLSLLRRVKTTKKIIYIQKVAHAIQFRVAPDKINVEKQARVSHPDSTAWVLRVLQGNRFATSTWAGDFKFGKAI